MAFWTYNGLKFGIKSVKFPKENDFYDGFISSVKIDAEKCLNKSNSAEKCKECELACPTDAINMNNLFDKVINANRCIFCGLCVDTCNNVAGSEGMGAISYSAGLDFDVVPQNYAVKKKIFKKSLFVKHIDTGSCGACESEINALNNPYYNMHRLGIFITPSPRFADVLLTTGTFTERMAEVFFNVLDNIPKPRFIVLAGSCAIFGGVFERREVGGNSFNAGLISSSETIEIFKNENVIILPHCPPNPFEILKVLLLIKNGGLK
jgi:Ni,Fe-hydrogenase III small subunit/NAD-dependent dihydropyrimidine dehydrogenase PreA subunit